MLHRLLLRLRLRLRKWLPSTSPLKSDVLFNFNKATLKPEGQQALDQLYTQLSNMDPKDGSAVVLGYTDRIGSEAYNQQLSEKRAPVRC